jgi:Type II intron maturase/AI2M/AI1M-like, HNH endonuclease
MGRNPAGRRGRRPGDKSRMSREAPVRFREGLGVKFPRATRLLLGFTGPKDEAEAIRQRIGGFLREHLKLELSLEKTLITHAVDDKAKFLGYEIKVQKANSLISANGRRDANGVIALLMPREAVQKVRRLYSGEGGKICHRVEIINDTDYTIIQRYQSVLRGIYNFYCMAHNVSRRADTVRQILEISLTKTLARKHRISVHQVYRKYRAIEDGRPVLKVVVPRTDKTPLVACFGGFPLVRKSQGMTPFDMTIETAWFRYGGDRSETVARMLSDKCDVCGKDGPVVMHHIHKLRDIDRPGRRPANKAERIMAARKRKSIPVCKECHRRIHSGEYDGPRIR